MFFHLAEHVETIRLPHHGWDYSVTVDAQPLSCPWQLMGRKRLLIPVNREKKPGFLKSDNELPVRVSNIL
jgi:hypothetical protein